MILIAHRGNVSGSSEYENHPDYIEEALKLGYDCEVDVWRKDDEYWLGHDEPVYDISKSFLQNNKLWCHAKNLEALDMMLNSDIHCFWHQKDDVTLTSKNIIWTYPKKRLLKGAACVMPELGYQGKIEECYAICTDYPKLYALKYNEVQ